MIETIFMVFVFVVLALVGLVVLHLGGLALLSKRWAWSASLILLMLIVVGASGLWLVMASIDAEGAPVPSSFYLLKISALFLYFAGCLIYIELRSLLSRGYSLRVLVDLHNRGGNVNLELLKSEYGDGMGIQGILDKRLRSMVGLRLLHFEDNKVGPLTLLGKVLAILGSGVRQLLRLEGVG